MGFSKGCFDSLETDTAGAATSASVTARGPEGEKIEVAWLAPGSTTPTVVSCTMPRGSAVSVQIGTANPKGSCVQVYRKNTRGETCKGDVEEWRLHLNEGLALVLFVKPYRNAAARWPQ